MLKTKSNRVDKVLVFLKTFFNATSYRCSVHINPHEFVQLHNNAIVINAILQKEQTS
ncbi:MAG: hypothetical protein ACN4GR_11150 [Arenicellales bacterium]